MKSVLNTVVENIFENCESVAQTAVEQGLSYICSFPPSLTITRVTNYTLLYSTLAITQVTGNRDGVDAEVIAHCLPFAMGEGRGVLLLLREAPF